MNNFGLIDPTTATTGNACSIQYVGIDTDSTVTRVASCIHRFCNPTVNFHDSKPRQAARINPAIEINDAVANFTVTISPESFGSSRTYDGTRKNTTRTTENAIGTNLSQKTRFALADAESPPKSLPETRQKSVEHKDRNVASANNVENVRHNPRSLYMRIDFYRLLTLCEFFALFLNQAIKFVQQTAIVFGYGIDDASQDRLGISIRMIPMVQ